MADENKPKEESTETLPDSPSEEKTADVIDDNAEDSSTEQTPDEVEAEWKSLSGKSQDRVRSLVERARRAEELLEAERTRKAAIAQDDNARVTTDYEVQEAIRRLRANGVPTIEDVKGLLSQVKEDQAHNSLMNRYDGSKGLPKYDRLEVEDYAKTHGFGNNYEAAYKDMYFDEFVDAARREKRHGVSIKPSAPIKEEPMTLEKLRAELRKPGGYEKLVAKDPQAFDKLVTQLTSSE